MKINKLVLNNFSSFEGTNEFDFSTKKGKNIILVGGKNGAGKTSLFSAIKIGLYGPLAFGYVSANNYYTAKIKEFINSKSFQMDSVQSGVMVDIEIMVDREVINYSITRDWTFRNQKLIESCKICQNGVSLGEEEKSYFHNYLMNIIPPALFDFFLFDGEEVGSIFSTSNYNSYVKNSLFTMCGMDVYEIIRKHTANYVAKNDDGLGADQGEYERLCEQHDNLEEEIRLCNEKIALMIEQKQDIDVELEELESAYKNAGGITEEERAGLDKEYAECERIKQENSAKIKYFVEGMMPFYIVKEFAQPIAKQVDYEDQESVFSLVQSKLNSIKVNTLPGADDQLVNAVKQALLKELAPSGDLSGKREAVYDLSKTEAGRVNAMIASLRSFNKNEILKMIEDKQRAAARTAEINRLLRSSMSDDEKQCFLDKENKLLKKREKALLDLQSAESELTEKTMAFQQISDELSKCKQQIMEATQNHHVYELSDGIAKMMSRLLDKKAISLRDKLEEQIVTNLHSIYRKHNLVTHIEIDANFQFNLFQDADYTASQLVSLINNLGENGFRNLVGNKGQSELYERFGVGSVAELLLKLNFERIDGKIHSFKRVELSRLSKGERQIFILSLHWAIIQISGQNIPFVIDTPYARIDANHRKEISEKFFPNISKQVIILSTDEEINEEYYGIVKPYVAKEYLLTNDEKENRTTVENRYFFEVTK